MRAVEQLARATREVPDFTDWVIGAARDLRWHAAHFRPARTEGGWRTAYQGDDGYQDLTLVHRSGVAIAAELKRYGLAGAKSAPTPAQQAWLDLWAAVPGVYAVCWTTLDWYEHRIQHLLANPAQVIELAKGQAA